MRILLIDDEDMVRDVLRCVLTEAGYDVVSATNGIEGLRALEAVSVDVVITDVLMPEKEGVETIFEIRKRRPSLRIIAISGGGRTRNLDPLGMARKVGADIALPKPVEPDVLLKAVRQLAEGRVETGHGPETTSG